jgi:exodeoxyribonuclease-3
MKILTYNVNGLRSALNKDWWQWLNTVNPDVVCLQEIKCFPSQVPTDLFEQGGYHCFWHPAEKAGYSGVAIFSKIKPNYVEIGCGIPEYDREGRVIRADFDSVSVISLYLPSGSSGKERQDVKMKFLADLIIYVGELRKKIPNLVISGDYNICHQAIDIHDPVRNATSSGFLPEEREWFTQFLATGMIDAFRWLHVEQPHHYTWWSYRAGARKKNLGWRIDYHVVTETLKEKIKSCTILSAAVHSDHCPVLLELEL